MDPLQLDGDSLKNTNRLLLDQVAATPSFQPEELDTSSLAELFEKVQRAKQEWEVTADSIPDLICLIDGLGRVVRANRTVITWNLSNVLDVRGQTLHALLHPYCSSLYCYLERFTQQALKSVAEGRPSEIKAFDQIRNRYYFIQVRLVDVTRSDPNNVAVVVVQDVTDWTVAADSLQRYTRRLEALDNIQRSILAARSPEDIIDTTIDQIQPLVPFDYAEVTVFDPATDQYYVVKTDSTHQPRLHAGHLVRKEELSHSTVSEDRHVVVIQDLLSLKILTDGQTRFINAGLRSYLNLPLKAEGEFMGSITLAAQRPDVFQREQVETLTEVADLLAIAAQHAQLNRRLIQVNNELTVALQARTEMIQNVSHELRTPLSLIYGYSKLIAAGDLGGVTGDQRAALKVIGDRSEQLRHMIDQILALRVMDPVVFERVPMDLGPWLQQIILAWQDYLKRWNRKAGLKLEVIPPVPPILGDPYSLKQLVENLLDNADKFSPHGGLIVVRLEHRAGLVVISVQDSGIGIEASDLKQLFVDFHQIDGKATRRFGGMGVGLALCRKIIAAHGGEIWAESAGLDKGSTFCVALPVATDWGPGQVNSTG